MGALADLQTQKNTFSLSSPLGQWLASQIASRVDAAIPASSAVTDGVHTVATSTQTSGNMTLTVTLRSGEAFTTASIAYNAAAATIETAIDSAATTASITGWTNGDITVSGGAVNAAPVVLTFDGTSVAGEAHPITLLTDVDGAGGAWGAVTRTTAGQTSRPAFAVLQNYDIVTGSPPEQDAAASTTSVTKGGGSGRVIPAPITKAIMREVASEDVNNGSYYSIQAALWPQDRSPQTETRLPTDDVDVLQ